MKDSHFRILRTHITAAGSYHGKAWKAFKPNRDVEDSPSKEVRPTAFPIVDKSDANIAVPSTPEKKIALFRSLFRGREDVYAARCEGKSGKSGYSPAGVMDWRAIHAAKPEERKRVARKTRTLRPRMCWCQCWPGCTRRGWQATPHWAIPLWKTRIREHLIFQIKLRCSHRQLWCHAD
jgi:hypothetical protein